MFLGLSKFCLILGKIACMWEGLCKDWGGKKNIFGQVGHAKETWTERPETKRQTTDQERTEFQKEGA